MVRHLTIRISDLVDRVNAMIAAKGPTRDERRFMMCFIENVLMDNENYGGFRYLEQGEVPEGELPGIVRDAGPSLEHKFPDDSRVCYHCRQR